ncbi:sodium-independent anion transporter [Actinoplanes sp. NPDC026619]|uniref:sodium-independent anion transporter n=1 Tax=Actinoplanes sp. NPDC026619 TaxID=3155798 RepID=UPI0033C93EE0
MTYLISTRRLPEPAMVIAIEPQGEIGSAEAADLLRSRFRMVVAATHPDCIVVDMSAVPAISEDGLDALRSGQDTAAADDASMVLVHAAPQVRDQLRRNGFAELVDRSDRPQEDA